VGARKAPRGERVDDEGMPRRDKASLLPERGRSHSPRASPEPRYRKGDGWMADRDPLARSFGCEASLEFG
jgi:hypothetical protein